MDVVTRVCELPLQFRIRGTVSVVDLVAESGYQSDPTVLTVDAVVGHLRAYPDLMDAWLAYSEDKRASSGWFIAQLSDDTFEVGYYPEGEHITVTGRALACAEFIVREIVAIAAS